MPLTLYVDGARWLAHQQQVRDAHPGIVPVMKGNGYGFGIDGLAAQAVEYAGEWDLPLSPLVYKAFALYMARRGR